MTGKKSVHKKTIITEVVEKKPSAKKASKNSSPKKSESNKRIETALIENFISLQKVMTNLSVKFDSLSTQISKLLDLFEISAKALAEKEVVTGSEKKDAKEIMQKMENILDQNKIIARGLALVHDRMSDEGEIPFSRPEFPPRPKLPEMQRPKTNSPVQPINQNSSDDGYHRSISSPNNESTKKSF